MQANHVERKLRWRVGLFCEAAVPITKETRLEAREVNHGRNAALADPVWQRPCGLEELGPGNFRIDGLRGMHILVSGQLANDARNPDARRKLEPVRDDGTVGARRTRDGPADLEKLAVVGGRAGSLGIEHQDIELFETDVHRGRRDLGPSTNRALTGRMLLRKVALLGLVAAFQTACGASNKGLPEEEFTMPRDPGEAAASSDQDKEPEVSPAERSARRARRHITLTSSAAASADPSAAPAVEAAAPDDDRDRAGPEIPLVLSDGSLSPSVIRATTTTAESARRAELLRAFGFAAADVEPVNHELRDAGEITEANIDGSGERGWVVHITSGQRGVTDETHFIAWLRHDGVGLRPIATRVEHVKNACCDGPKSNGEVRVEVMNVHSTTVADTVIWREQTDPHATMTDASRIARSVDIVSVEHKKAEPIFHWDAASKPNAAHDGVIIGDADDAPRPIVLFTAAGKPKKTYTFDTKAFSYK